MALNKETFGKELFEIFKSNYNRVASVIGIPELVDVYRTGFYDTVEFMEGFLALKSEYQHIQKLSEYIVDFARETAAIGGQRAAANRVKNVDYFVSKTASVIMAEIYLKPIKEDQATAYPSEEILSSNESKKEWISKEVNKHYDRLKDKTLPAMFSTVCSRKYYLRALADYTGKDKNTAFDFITKPAAVGLLNRVRFAGVNYLMLVKSTIGVSHPVKMDSAIVTLMKKLHKTNSYQKFAENCGNGYASAAVNLVLQILIFELIQSKIAKTFPKEVELWKATDYRARIAFRQRKMFLTEKTLAANTDTVLMIDNRLDDELEIYRDFIFKFKSMSEGHSVEAEGALCRAMFDKAVEFLNELDPEVAFNHMFNVDKIVEHIVK